jgi:adenylate cyclase
MPLSFQQWFQQWRPVLIIAPAVAGLVIGGSYLGLFRLLEWAVWDQFVRLRPSQGIEDRIVIVTIDEQDIRNLQAWPMSDRVMAQLLSNIKAQQPKAIGIDIYRDLVVEPGHADLVKLFETTPNLIGIEKVAGKTVAPPPTLDALDQVAASDLLVDTDSKIRRGLVLAERSDGVSRQGLGVILALTALAQEGLELSVLDEQKKIYGLGKGKFIPLSGREGVYTQPETGGYQILLDYRGGLEHFPRLSLTEALAGRIPPGFMHDRIVMIGATASDLNDLHPTPYNSTLLQSIDRLPGVIIHATLASQILSAALEGRPMLRASAKSLNWFWIVIWSGYGAAIGTYYVRNSWVTWIGLLLASVTVVGGSYLCFLSSWLIPVFTPLLTVISAGSIGVRVALANRLRLSYKELTQQHQLLQRTYDMLQATSEAYSRFVPFEYLELLKKPTILDVKLGDHVTKTMAIMFSDIRLFTTLSEAMTPQETFDFVNVYLQEVSPEIRNQEGLVVKFLGDGIMSVFPRGADAAIVAGIRQHHKIRDYNQKQIEQGATPIRVGIAIHIGRIMVGIVGEASRMQVDTLSDHVNLAARLESLTKLYGVSLLISESVLNRIADRAAYQIRFLDRVIVKGRNESIAIYEVLDAEPEKAKGLKLATQQIFGQALQCYYNQNFPQARIFIKQVLKANPLDKTAKLYLERIEHLLKYGTPPDWDGIWRFTEK